MPVDQLVVFGTLLLALGLFAWGRIRHDLVALLSLSVLVVAGIVEPGTAFAGFGHPAVITVAAVLVIGRGLERSGLIDLLARWVTRVGTNLVVQVVVLTALVAAASAFMNNVGALAIMMPVAIQLARRGGHSPSLVLMPLAFGSLLGGMTTLIGTPPNIIVAAFRAGETGTPFGMFDFTPVGVSVTLAGLAFIGLVGWRLLPKRPAPKSDQDLFDIDDYITEVEVGAESRAAGRTVAELAALAGADLQLLALVRHDHWIHAPEPNLVIEAGDVLVLETDAEELKTVVHETGVCLAGTCRPGRSPAGAAEIGVAEAVVTADSPLVDRTAADVQLRRRHGVNLLAVARREQRVHNRLASIAFRPGDVLLLQGRRELLQDTIAELGCLPLAPRGLRLGYRRRIPLALGIFGAALGVVVAGLLPVEVAFTIAALAMVLGRVLPLDELYHAVDWPVIVLLGAMIPVGGALETTGGAARVAEAVTALGRGVPAWLLLAALLLVTMLLSAVINNAATALLMGPVAVGVAKGLGYAVDPFLMAVAIGASAAFLTPIGHQSNTLVMGPGGYRFTDYARLGLPLTFVVLLVGVPVILWWFPA